MKKLNILIFCGLLSSCSILPNVFDLFSTPSDGVTVDTDIRTDIIEGNKSIGTEAETIVDSKIIGKEETTNTTNTAGSIIYNTHHVDESISISEIVLLMLMSFLLGWLAMPSVRQMWLMFKNRLKQ